jgi:methionyl aminopeptidase
MIIKNNDELNKISTAAKINSECLQYLKDLVEPGISSLEVDTKAGEFYKKKNVKPAFLGIYGYPAVINFMIDNQVVHNIPNKNQIVKEGDLVSIDTGCIYEGFYGDQAVSFGVGKITIEDEKLLSIGALSVKAGLRQCVTGNTIGDIGYAQQSTIEIAGFSVVKQYVGHEIGRKLHDTLKIPAYGTKGTGTKLPENVVLAIENQVTNGSDEVYVDKKNQWTVYTVDGSKAITFEHMVVVQKNKPLVLSLEIV